ncbi:MAG TPA: zinc-binding dehydrogenase [Trebonia sp.]|nr:zinc-binding dehydrogenase [Trebonia sp.]
MTESLAAVLSAPRTIDVRPVPAGPLPAAGAWLEVEACGICGSDWSWYAEREIPAPFVPGHEMVGRIVAAWGDHGNAAFTPGARVAVEEALPCWSCAECRGGKHRLCPRSTRYGGTPLSVAPAVWGGFSQYTYLAPRTSAHAVPDSLDAGLATLFIPVSNGLSWLRAAGRLQPGESVVVLGVGQHGLASVAAARRCGAGTVVAVGRSGDQARLDAAAKLGADLAVDSDSADWAAAVLDATGQRGADLLVDTTPGATGILATAATCAAIGGRVIVAGLKHGASSALPTDVLVRREIAVRGVAARESWAIDAALSWLAQEPALFSAFSSVTTGLADVEQALLALGGEAAGPRPVHAVVTPHSG